MFPIDPAVLVALKARHLAFFEARLVSDKAAAEWGANLGAVYRDLLATRVGDLAQGSALADAADAILTSDAVERALRPAAKRALPELLRLLRAEKGTIGDRVPAAAQTRLTALLDRPGLIPERFLREIVKEDAVDDVMRDVLFDALMQFSDKVNPFFAEWGLPALLKKISPFGIGRGLDSLRAEFDRRLEPEIRKFLQGFSKQSLERMANFTIVHGDEPKFLAVRKHLASWLLAQEVASLARSADAEALSLGLDFALDVTAAELARSEHRALRRATIEREIAARKDRTLGEVLAELGVVFTPDFGALAAATWPAVRSVFASPATKAWLGSLIEEFYDAEIAAAGE